MKKRLFLIIAIVLSLSIASCKTNETNNVISRNESSNPPSESSIDSNLSDIETSVSQNPENPEIPETSNPSAPPEIPKEDTVINFLACPDNIIHPSVYKDAIDRAAAQNGTSSNYSDLHNAVYDFAPIYEYIAEDVKNAHIAYLNQETLLGGTSGGISGYPCFNTPTALIETISALEFDVVNVAHNHMLDSGDTDYLENCNKLLEEKDIKVIGYYPNKESLNNIRVIEREGIKVAFLSYTYGTNGQRLPKGSSFVIPLFSEELLTNQVTLAKSLADIVVVSCHWGDENTFIPNKMQKKYASLMCELEVDVVLGMHPHVIQPMEWMTSSNGSKTLVIYSLGNLVSGMARGKNMLGGLFYMDIRKDAETGEVTIESPMFLPIVCHYNKSQRNYKIYYLSDYTEDLALSHGVHKYEGSKGTLEGGIFNLENLYKTLNKYISNEFLPEEYHHFK